jgi:hypothetical protein
MDARDLDLKDYLTENFGSCKLQNNCTCLRQGWMGTNCPHWVPVQASNYEELGKIMRSLYE